MALPLFNIGGLASGLDTSAMIDSLIQVERIPVQQLTSRKAEMQATDTAWQTINTKLSSLRSALEAIATGTDLDKLVTATSSNEAAMTASPSGAATPSTLSFTIDQLAANHQAASDTDFTGGDDLVGAGDLTLTINGTDHVVSADATTTLNDLAFSINDLDVGVTASVVSIDGTDYKLMLSSQETGLENAFSTSATIASLGVTNVVQQGQDAELTIGSGVGALTITRPSNTVADLVDGVTINLHETSATAVTLTVGRDIDATVDKVSAFVEELNSTLNTLKDYTRYDPVGETAGVLVGDSTARNLMIDLRNALTSVVNDQNGDYAVSGSIGLGLNRDGTVDIDETTLRSALEDDFAAVADLLTTAGTAAGGIAGAFDTVLDEAEGAAGTVARARDAWQSQIAIIDDRIEVLEDRIDRREALLIKQFAALETAMSTLSSQAAWLASQLGAQSSAS
jgi:flagellar hook-associated protein 2